MKAGMYGTIIMRKLPLLEVFPEGITILGSIDLYAVEEGAVRFHRERCRRRMFAKKMSITAFDLMQPTYLEIAVNVMR